MTIEHPAELNAIIYALFSAPGLDREAAAGMVKSMLAGQYFLDRPAAYSRAIEQALAQPDPVTAALEPPFSETEVRKFLRLVHEELAKAKPWPATT
ncbi:hypothetical protein [Streptoalloteichus hindustanus]|uniref:CdiI immunity protein domain-containing protein n=1 Tax=Streptoalloteichus hindustanus TaxID=2017 RepID=A0A1M5MAZ2_STRHI|nr:hypothetical protein [Streptoalloteichus hindustanus]SHG73873.1 hypothetical protein SAMN05444320_11339 [Streptoalloteichus hindustanus]